MNTNSFPSQDVVFKGENHRGEKCFSITIGDKIVDAIQNAFGDLEVVKFVGKQMMRVPLSVTGIL